MEFIVNGKSFADYEQAKLYEEELKKVETEEQTKRETFIRDNICGLVVKTDTSSFKLVCITDTEDKALFLEGALHRKFGDMTTLRREGNKFRVKKLYSVEKISDTDLQVIADYFVQHTNHDLSIEGNFNLKDVGTVVFVKDAIVSESGDNECRHLGEEFNSLFDFIQHILN